MDQSSVSEQVVPKTSDVPTVDETGQTSVLQQEEGTAKTNKDAKEWRKSDKEWQDMQEQAKKGSDAAVILERLSSALGIKKEESQEEQIDPIESITQKVDALQTELALSKWEKTHPAVDTAENREAWQKIVQEKGHLVKSGDLTYDDLWAIVRKGSKPSTSEQDFKNQEMSVGSVPTASKVTVSGTEIDPEIYAVMKQAGYTDEQIKMSA